MFDSDLILIISFLCISLMNHVNMYWFTCKKEKYWFTVKVNCAETDLTGMQKWQVLWLDFSRFYRVKNIGGNIYVICWVWINEQMGKC